MTTYNTYAEAKIANPDSEIYVYGGRFLPEYLIQPSHETYERRGYFKCHPKDYCMSVADFMDNGYKYVDGDSYLGADGDVYTVGVDFSSVFANLKRNSAANRYILRAKALETQPAEVEIDNTPQQVESLSSAATTKLATKGATKVPTKVEYVKVEYNHIWEIMKMQSEGVDFYIKSDDVESGYSLVQNNPTSLLVATTYDLYLRIEKELTWQEYVESIYPFVEFSTKNKSVHINTKQSIGEEDYLEMCRVTLRAIGEIE